MCVFFQDSIHSLRPHLQRVGESLQFAVLQQSEGDPIEQFPSRELDERNAPIDRNHVRFFHLPRAQHRKTTKVSRVRAHRPRLR